jgi:hypothetical protein
MSITPKVDLINFWPDGYVGHTDAQGNDIGKDFLRSLFVDNDGSKYNPVEVTSHFFKPKRLIFFMKITQALVRRMKKNRLLERKILHGHNSDRYKLNQRAINVWYTSENVRPPLEEEFDAYLSHDLDEYDGRNIYLPIWATRLGPNLIDAFEEQKKLLSHRIPPNVATRGICAVISNPEPIRMAFLSEAQKHFDVDVFGAFGTPIATKESVLGNYKINICFENDEFPGYVTEKPIEAWLSGCVPIWRGIDSGEYLNEDAIINVSQLGFSEALRRIDLILRDDAEYLRMSSLPILKKQYDYKRLEQKISETCYK